MIYDRCNSEGINCEYFQTWTLTDICPKFKQKNQMWSSIVQSLHPTFECPIKVRKLYLLLNINNNNFNIYINFKIFKKTNIISFVR